MNPRALILRSLRFYWRTHVGVVLGAAVATAILVGALAVGDSVRYTLARIARSRLGRVELAVAPRDRFFRAALAEALARELDVPVAAALVLDGSIKRPNTDDPARGVQVLGVDGAFWSLSPAGRAPAGFDDLRNDEVFINEALAAKLALGPGENWVLIKVSRPGLLSRDAPLSGSTKNFATLRAKVRAVAGTDAFGRFDLRANQMAPYNVYLPRARLGRLIKLGIDAPPGPTTGPAGKPRPRTREATLADKANVLLIAGGPGITRESANAALRKAWTLDDANVRVRELGRRGVVEARTARVFLDEGVARASAGLPGAMGVLTYLVNEIRVVSKADPRPLASAAASWCAAAHSPEQVGEMMRLAYEISLWRRSTPYSMVSALGPLPGAAKPAGAADPPAPPSFRIVPPEMRDDEIVINRWLAEDLAVKVDDRVALEYFVLAPGRRFVAQSRTFRVRKIVPLTKETAERELMPDFPDLAGKNSCAEWDPGLPAEEVRKIKQKVGPEDERYWRDFRGTPKAFVTLSAGQGMWSNRFGGLTGVRWPLAGRSAASAASAILDGIEPGQIGLFCQPVGERARKAGSDALDFGPLFLGLSMFLIAAALILTGLLFAFNVQQRTEEVGTLLAVGFKPGRVRWLLLAEGGLLAVLGAAIGTPAGLAYTRAVLGGLATVWQGAVAGSEVRFHADPLRVLTGVGGGIVVAVVSILVVLWRQARRPARELLAGGDASAVAAGPRRALAAGILAGACAAAASAAVIFAAVAGEGVQVAMFFLAGALLLVAGIAAARVLLSAMAARAAGGGMSLASLGLQNATRRGGRSLAVVGLLACGSFLVIAVAANRRGETPDVREASSPAGGFALYAESSVGVLHDLGSEQGRAQLRLKPADFAGVEVVAGRLLEGDDASCLNLNRAQVPRLIGIQSDRLRSRRAFRFVRTLDDRSRDDPWSLLKGGDADVVPAIADQPTLQWALGKKLGEELTYVDERGRPFQVRLVAALGGSILQGSLLIDEEQFVARFPSRAGYRVFLIDAPPGRTGPVAKALARDLENYGFQATPTADRLAAFNEVQNTYLAIFQALGALGLLLGSAGLALVVLRNVLERRRELALLRAVGFSRGRLRVMILYEHWGLLAGGLVCGVVSAAVAVYPAVLSAGGDVPYASLAWMLTGVAVGGVLWTVLAAVVALRGPLLGALRNE